MEPIDDLIRPQSWEDFVGQDALKERLEVHVSAALRENRPMESVFLYGLPGFGKTTLAKLLAEMLTDAIKVLVMPMDRDSLVHQVSTFPGGVLFLDELHSMTKKDQELLLPLLDRNTIVAKTGRQFEIPWLTVVGATTERDKIIAPLHDRFAIRPDLAAYTNDELAMIVAAMARRMNVPLSEETALRLGVASAGVPRNARQLVVAARDLAVAYGTTPSADEVLEMVQVDAQGLSAGHRLYLEAVYGMNGRAGEKTLESLLRLSASERRNLERLLLQLDMIELSPVGRKLTPNGVTTVMGLEAQAYTRR